MTAPQPNALCLFTSSGAADIRSRSTRRRDPRRGIPCARSRSFASRCEARDRANIHGVDNDRQRHESNDARERRFLESLEACARSVWHLAANPLPAASSHQVCGSPDPAQRLFALDSERAVRNHHARSREWGSLARCMAGGFTSLFRRTSRSESGATSLRRHWSTPGSAPASPALGFASLQWWPLVSLVVRSRTESRDVDCERQPALSQPRATPLSRKRHARVATDTRACDRQAVPSSPTW